MRKKTRAYRKILRSKQAKEERRRKEKDLYTPDKVFSYKNFIVSARKSYKGMSWKASVQNHMLGPISKTYKDYKAIKAGIIPGCASGREKTITERGRTRIITPVNIRGRVLQKVPCDNALVSVIRTKLIYDNGASLKGKGVEFTRRRIKKFLCRMIKKFGDDFYVLTFDFSNFFGSIPHRECRRMMEKYFREDFVDLVMGIIKNPFRGKCRKIKDKAARKQRMRELDADQTIGICLGNEESQPMALLVPSEIDHYIKDRLRIKCDSRYMDDGIIMAKTKNQLTDILCGIKSIAERLGLKLSEKKTRIAKARKGFTFLKIKYNVSKTGKIIRRLTKKGIVTMRRKLKKFQRKLKAGEMTLTDINNSMQSWMQHAKSARSFKTTSRMKKLYKKLFGIKFVPGKKRRARRRDVLQDRIREKYRWHCLEC